MGFSVGDIFGKNFLSADTIIGGQKKTFNASVTDISGLGSRVTLANLIQYYQDQAGTQAQRTAAKDVIKKFRYYPIRHIARTIHTTWSNDIIIEAISLCE